MVKNFKVFYRMVYFFVVIDDIFYVIGGREEIFSFIGSVVFKFKLVMLILLKDLNILFDLEEILGDKDKGLIIFFEGNLGDKDKGLIIFFEDKLVEDGDVFFVIIMVNGL